MNTVDKKITLLNQNIVRKGYPADVETMNALAKSETYAYEAACNYFDYHVDFGRLRAAICATWEKMTGVAREHKTETTKKGTERKVYTETEGAYQERLEALATEDDAAFTIHQLNEWAQEAADECTLDFTKKVRSGSSGEPAKKWLAMFDQAESDGVLEEKIENFNTIHKESGRYTGPALDIEQEDLRVAFANACKEVVTKLTKEVTAGI